jgi:hypothetical protein
LFVACRGLNIKSHDGTGSVPLAVAVTTVAGNVR